MTTSTRAEILTYLKRTGSGSVADLALELTLAPITVRQHLVRLERDGLLAAETQPSPGGRPHYVYRLTARAHAAAFPRRTDRIMELLVREIGCLESADLLSKSEIQKVRLVLSRVASRLADEYAPLLSTWSLGERVAFVTEVMHAENGLAEWKSTDDGFEIRDYNCVFHRLIARDDSSDCDWHREFLAKTLGTEVVPVPCSDAVGQCCRFAIVGYAPVPQPARTPEASHA
jgi:predicted ArsR family transcriptional regulator